MKRLSLKCTEKQVQNAISDYLTARRIMHRRTNSGMLKIAGRFIKFAFWLYPKSKFMKYKILDIDGILPDGRAFYLEVKATGKIPDKGQINTMSYINNNTNAVALWADSVDIFIEKFERAIRL